MRRSTLCPQIKRQVFQFIIAVGVLIVMLLQAACDGGRQQRMAEEGVRRLADAYNRSQCVELYVDADERFFNYVTKDEWAAACASIQKAHGQWLDFETEFSTISFPPDVGVVWVRGPVKFERGTAKVRVDWVLAEGKAHLNHFILEDGERTISLPDSNRGAKKKQ